MFDINNFRSGCLPMRTGRRESVTNRMMHCLCNRHSETITTNGRGDLVVSLNSEDYIVKNQLELSLCL